MPVSVSTNGSSRAYDSPASGSTLAGVRASIQPLNASTTTPIAASAPNARRKRSASGTVISCARSSRKPTCWRAASATAQHRRHRDHLQQQHLPVAALERVADQPDHLDDPGDHHADHRLGRDPRERAGGVHEVFLAGPGEHHAGDQRHTAEPHRRGEQVAEADQHARATAAGPSTRLSATATRAAPGRPHAHIAVVGSMIRSGRMATQPQPATSTSRSSAPGRASRRR